MNGDAAAVFRPLFNEHLHRWRAGLKRGGEGRRLGDWLACKDIEELYAEAARSVR